MHGDHQDDADERGPRQPERAGAVLDGVRGGHVADAGDPGEHRDPAEHLREVVAQHRRQRQGHRPGLLDRDELRALLDAQPHVEPDADEQRAEQERDAPAPGAEGLGGHRGGEHEEHRVGGDQAERHAELGEAAVEAALGLGRVLHRDEHRPAPLAAHREALHEAQHHEQDRGERADRGVGGQDTDERGGHAHRHQRRDERGLAADPVAEVTEDHAADGAGEEPDGERRERRERAGQRRDVREELRREHRDGGEAVDVEVVPLDGRAHEARERDLADLASRGWCGVGRGGGHGALLGRRERASG